MWSQLALDLALGISVDAAYDTLEPGAGHDRNTKGGGSRGGDHGESFDSAAPGRRHQASGVERQLLGPTSIQVGMGLLIATYCGDPESPSPWAEPLSNNAANTLG